MRRKIQVAVRLRPGEGGGTSCVTVEGDSKKNVVVTNLVGAHASCVPRCFIVDQVFWESCTNDELFRCMVHNRILSSINEPDTSCFLAYGHTSSGKTHSIVGTTTDPGLLSLCAKAVIHTYGMAEVAMLEVYGEAVHDLLARGQPRVIRRRSSPTGGPLILVEGLTTCSVTSMEEWDAVSEFGLQTRRTAPTERNARSSRSHAVFTIKSKGLRLCLVDLAGSERQTSYSPQLNKESIAINKSLSRLSTVLEALSRARLKSNGTSSYVNFRDTTLTVLLQRYLSGASMTVFLACIHPDTRFYEETLSTMRYTERLKCISTKPPPQKPNEDMSLFSSAEKRDLLAELLLLRKIVREQQQGYQHSQQLQSGHGGDVASFTAAEQLTCNLPKSHLGEFERFSFSNNAAKQSLFVSGQCRQRLLRSKDTTRVAGWLLSRVLGELPELFIGFDDYFDSYLPLQVKVVGYVSLMACLASRDASEAEATLAFLDVGDVAMGLMMLDAGIPSCVRLHHLRCGECDSWEAHEYDEVNKIFVLAFFEISEHLVETTDRTSNAFECCEGFLTTEPLVPLAIVLCTPVDASDELKETILQHLVTLQGEQENAMVRAADDSLLNMQDNEEVVFVGSPSAMEEVMQWRFECCNEWSGSSSDSNLLQTSLLVDTIGDRAVTSPGPHLLFQKSGSLDFEAKTVNLPTLSSDNPTRRIVAPFFVSMPTFSSSSSLLSVSQLKSSPLASGVCKGLLASSAPLTCGEEEAQVVPGSDMMTTESCVSHTGSIDTTSRKDALSVAEAKDHAANERDTSALHLDLRTRVCHDVSSPLCWQSAIVFAHETAETIDNILCKEKDNETHAPLASTALRRDNLAQVEYNKKGKQKCKNKRFHRLRKPVLEDCHACTVL